MSGEGGVTTIVTDAVSDFLSDVLLGVKKEPIRRIGGGLFFVVVFFPKVITHMLKEVISSLILWCLGSAGREPSEDTRFRVCRPWGGLGRA